MTMRVPSIQKAPSREVTIAKSASPFAVFREGSEDAGIVFLPGFTGEVTSSWGNFAQFLMQEGPLASWGVYGLNYASRRRIDISGVWEADPDISLLARYVATELTLGVFAKLKSIAFIAHSMGGLVVQRAVLDNGVLEGRTSHIVMFGTPSLGIKKAGLGALLKRQARDMTAGSKFIAGLRGDWDKRYPGKPPFSLIAAGGDKDEFVGPASSLLPFPDECCEVVPGNHETIVRPETADNLSVRLAVRALTGGQGDYVDSARLAVELGNFRAAKQVLLPNFDKLDSSALVILAMALDGLGEGDEALRILDDVYEGGKLDSAEAAGIIAGRVKRRWLLERKVDDLKRSRELYAWGLQEAEKNGDHAQIYYHAINVAFLDLMSAAATADLMTTTNAMATKALQHCQVAPETNWRFATEGEANLMLGNWQDAEEGYRRCVALSPAPRELISTRNQALRVVGRLYDSKKVEELAGWFSAVSEFT